MIKKDILKLYNPKKIDDLEINLAANLYKNAIRQGKTSEQAIKSVIGFALSTREILVSLLPKVKRIKNDRTK